ncbi:cell division protein FtsZ [Candidatus Falkowbacteria bacterium]|uniref:Cell division protein FtsZ n=1 Tax=Candidatus Buchananbacteria bacterium CG10_big_fil_rev_8_21_14_0_10_33_19 TaxID=1974525 RepID=A0A2H0W2Y6_9BACT|nr:cell division protein FtsZ [Candidatus Falkowbacteria bacterium]PIS05706.1 MAG: cell division protein FtsZ [Candidatus Buchananbacteria bacterium CG10_big_fil_rev_8_21_14_0_10_33_19]
MPEVRLEVEPFAKIKVVGVGGSGGSAVNRMIASKIKGVEFIAVNTDIQALHHNDAKHKLHIGEATTKGLGAGMDPNVGFQAAQESINELREILKGADMVFITCGLGGGTGTGASPVVAQIAKEIGALVIAVVTKPFAFEGAKRKEIAENGYKELESRVDTIITIPNDKILQIIDKKTSLLDAFKTVDDVLRQGIQGISEAITIPGIINVDFADVKAIMNNAGSSLMGIGEATGENRAISAAKKAISSPLLDISIDGARGVMFILTGGSNLTMNEVNDVGNIIAESVDANAKIIFGTVIDENMKDKVRVTVVATGFDDNRQSQPMSRSTTSLEEPKYHVNRLFSKKNIDDRIEEVKKTIESPKEEIIKPATIESKPFKRVVPEEDDLEIPAFIRRKMK